METELKLASPFVLKDGFTLKNRLIKSALSEGLAHTDGRLSKELIQLYRTWSQSGVEVLITGNVMIDSRAISELGNVIIENEKDKGLGIFKTRRLRAS
ncbi:hypothetical protein [Acinetobacter sp. RW6]|uniref:hypothetical protein n=1 Tax=Acinetobacter sp. RW6 TaxID=3242680 RepID=UPI0035C1B771